MIRNIWSLHGTSFTLWLNWLGLWYWYPSLCKSRKSTLWKASITWLIPATSKFPRLSVHNQRQIFSHDKFGRWCFQRSRIMWTWAVPKLHIQWIFNGLTQQSFLVVTLSELKLLSPHAETKSRLYVRGSRWPQRCVWTTLHGSCTLPLSPQIKPVNYSTH